MRDEMDTLASQDHSSMTGGVHLKVRYSFISDTIICKTAITFGVTYAMAPATQLIVYYLKEDNETVADHLPLKVEPRFENEVSRTRTILISCAKKNISKY